MRAIILDGPDSWSQTLVTEGVVDKFIGIDFAEAESVFDRCCAAVQSVQKVPHLALFELLVSCTVCCMLLYACSYMPALVITAAAADMQRCSEPTQPSIPVVPSLCTSQCWMGCSTLGSWMGS